MTAQNRTADWQTRNRLLSHASKVLHDLGRIESAKLLNRYLRTDITDTKAQIANGIRPAFEPPTPGYEIAEHLQLMPTRNHLQKKNAAIGIVSDQAAQKMQPFFVKADLPYDGYDRTWAEHAPDMLVIEAEALAEKFGWQHALTLRDVSATAELATMIQKARAAGMTTILIRPAAAHRFPLLSRVADAFDHVVDNSIEITQLRAA